MATADFWHEMAGEFERVDPIGRLHLIVARGMTTNRLQLVANSDFVPLLVRDKFHALAARAGAELDPDSDSPIQAWLVELERTNRPDVIDPPLELTDPYTDRREHHKVHQINDLGTLSAALCYRLETKERHIFQPKPESEQRREMIDAHFNIKLQAEIEAKKEFLKRKFVKEMEDQERNSKSNEAFQNLVTLLESDAGTLPSQVPVQQQSHPIETPGQLITSYFGQFPEKIKVLDVCWAAGQYYREWKRWKAGLCKKGSTPDKAFTAIMTSGKRPNEYRATPRPNNWK